jgi:hypothetical protein
VEIPANGSGVMVFYLEVHKPGPFAFELPLYLDDAGFRQVTVTVKGTAVAASAGK